MQSEYLVICISFLALCIHFKLNLPFYTYIFIFINLLPENLSIPFLIYEMIVISQADRNFSHFYMFYCIIALQIEILVV